MSLTGKTVVVTGSSRGIGKVIALAFAAAGANLVLNARSGISDELLAEVAQYGVRSLVCLGDVSDYEFAKSMIEEAHSTFGSVDVLVNNAGITRDKLLLRMDEADFDATYQCNLKGSFNTIRHAVPIMLKQRSGAIINLSSVVGQTGNIGQANYAASKAGIIGLTQSVAREVAARGIICNAIAPGFIETDMTDQLSSKVKDDLLQNIPLKRIGRAEEVAELAVFLATSNYITGQTIAINGGMYM